MTHLYNNYNIYNHSVLHNYSKGYVSLSRWKIIQVGSKPTSIKPEIEPVKKKMKKQHENLFAI